MGISSAIWLIYGNHTHAYAIVDGGRWEMPLDPVIDPDTAEPVRYATPGELADWDQKVTMLRCTDLYKMAQQRGLIFLACEHRVVEEMADLRRGAR